MTWAGCESMTFRIKRNTGPKNQQT